MKENNLTTERVKIVTVDLFAGGGFLSLGLRMAGMAIGYANEWNFHACRLHMANFVDEGNVPVMEPFLPITKEEYLYFKNHKNENGQKDLEDTVGILMLIFLHLMFS